MNLNNEMLTPIGTIGWFAMLVIGPIKRRQYGEVLIPIIFGMVIIDAWAVAPSALRQVHPTGMEWKLWAAALFPYLVMLYWGSKTFFYPTAKTKITHD